MDPLLQSILVLTVLLLAYLSWEQRGTIKRYRFLLKKYSPIINIDRTIKKQNIQKDKLIEQIKELEQAYKNLKKEHDIYYDDLEMVSYGHYTPHYDFQESAIYKYTLDRIRTNQKQLIKNKKAIISTVHLTVDGNLKQGRKMTNKIIKLALNTFNVQADNTILKVTSSNINNSKKRWERIKDNINKLLEPYYCCLTSDFFNLKIQELYLAYEYEEKCQQEKEEQRRIKQQIKKEIRKEIAELEAEANKEERIFQNALEQFRKKTITTNTHQRNMYEMKIKNLEKQLAKTQQKRERALSMAQQTKSGHVYIISDIGSFGEKVYKVGVTRRREPIERVKELGDASVPFEFDIHAMIHSKNAPELEQNLLKSFSDFRVNRINSRKEFFKIDLEQIEKNVMI